MLAGPGAGAGGNHGSVMIVSRKRRLVSATNKWTVDLVFGASQPRVGDAPASTIAGDSDWVTMPTMSKRRLIRWSLVLAILAAFAVWLEPTRVVWGWLRGEAFYDGRPTSYWAAQIEPWDSYCSLGGHGSLGWFQVDCHYVRKLSPFHRWLKRYVNTPESTWPAILDGDREAQAVLQQLLEHPSDVVRDWAQEGINRIGTQDKGPRISAWSRMDGIPRRKMPGVEVGLEVLWSSLRSE